MLSTASPRIPRRPVDQNGGVMEAAAAGPGGLLPLGPTPRERAVARDLGAVYTPQELAEFVLDMALEGRPDLLEGRVLEPACGPGVFLVAILRRIALRLT